VWTAFDIVLALIDANCNTFSRVEIVIEAQGAPSPSRVYAAVDTSDLAAFRSGVLSEHVFIDQVQYRVGSVDDNDQ
jgi:hypothetical protein